MLNKSDYYKIGEIRKTHGVKGEMMLMNDSPIDSEAIKDWIFFNIEECLIPFNTKSLRASSDKTILFICQEINSIEEAEKYVGTEVFMPISSRRIENDIDTPESLIGVEVINDETKETLGRVSDFIESNFNPLLEIEYKDDSILLPFNDEFILGLEDHKLYVILPDGILDL
jgi:16S rRNA processing protein RimM